MNIDSSSTLKNQPQASSSSSSAAEEAARGGSPVHDNADSQYKVETNWNQVNSSFDDIGLSRDILRGVYAHGFEKPTPIQERAISAFFTGRDILAQAQSGTGKTGAFCLGALQRIDFISAPSAADNDAEPDGTTSGGRRTTGGPQVIFLAPTRELADQTFKVLSALGLYTPLRCLLCIGGTSVIDNVKTLDRDHPHAVVATPGRLLDLIERRAFDTRSVKLMVIDEADEMLDQGFKDAVHSIFRYLPSDSQVALFSATMPPDVLALTEQFMRDPLRFLLKKETVTLQGIKQFYVPLERDAYKFDTLCDLYDSMSVSQAVIFCNSRRRVVELVERLRERDFTVSALHSELDPSERRRVMDEFRSCASRILVATDILARGIDVVGVSLVVNYDLPTDREQYIHRIGRCGRHGRKGVTINFVTDRDAHIKQELERFYGTVIEELPIDFVKHMGGY